MKNEKIQISNNKSLKLTNVLIKEIDLKESENLEKEVYQMENYLKNKGACPIGPLIQYSKVELTESQEPKLVVKLLRQSNTFLHNIRSPYNMESVIRARNCMYARFNGEESKLKLAYDKINVTAFEEDIKLKGDSYTVFVDKNDDEIIADVFMERVDNE
ncbi:hypothetical protein RBH29_09755 [Herbivorax sp. ANBcel31]|uniref:hypothetical protein n=1 Tax=Herbivorax sp. ANBcel31 TaxID=3069754 RepID=UPI0027AFE63C|nr:hypothetical protein [Herbivorax sp. ANBcel31]MDQ2086709.1 hypothetical protein [Herbivorax sp. ANBcel31]